MFVADDRALYISGKKVDKIIRLSPLRDQQDFSRSLTVVEPGFNSNLQQETPSVNNVDIRLYVRGLWNSEIEELIQSNEEYRAGQNINDIMFSTLLCDRRPPWNAVLSEDSNFSAQGSDTGDLTNEDRAKRDVLKDINRNWSTHRRCLTSAGLVGQVPIDAAEGDFIAIFMGAAVPFIIRPNKEGYQLIGQAYVHALMGGKALESRFGPVESIKLV